MSFFWWLGGLMILTSFCINEAQSQSYCISNTQPDNGSTNAVIIEEDDDDWKYILPILLLMLSERGSRNGGSGNCCGGCGTNVIPVPYPIPVPIVNTANYCS